MSDVVHTNDNQPAKNQRLRRSGIAGIALGTLALVACELPIILTLIGLGNLSTAAMPLRPPFNVEVAGILVAMAGAMLLVISAFRRRWSRKKRIQ